MPAPSVIFLDRILPGGLAGFVATRREQGQSFDRIARAIQDEADFYVTAQTVRRWCETLDTTGDAA